MRSKKIKIAVLPGDGIGPEVIAEGVKILDKISEKFNCGFSYKYADIGGIAIDNYGEALPKETLEICKNSNAILFGAVGGKKWKSLPSEKQPERASLLRLRKIFDLYANLRPAIFFGALRNVSPLKKKIIAEGHEVLIVRELTSGEYFGKKSKGKNWASDEIRYNDTEIERITKVAFELAMKRRKKVTSIDKANVLESMILWRRKIEEISKSYPKVDFNSMYIDNAAMQLVKNPNQFDVLLCPNMFGDILSDLTAGLVGSLGLLPSASLNIKNKFGLYEPIHGSAPDIAGKGIANPIAAILSVGMMLRYSFNLEDASFAIEKAVEKVLDDGYRTADITEKGKKKVSTREMGDLIAERI